MANTLSASWPLRAAAELERRRQLATIHTTGPSDADWERWRASPATWMRERLNLPIRSWADFAPARYAGRTWDGTPEPIVAMGLTLAAGQSAAVSSGPGVGKTFGAAGLVFWWLDCWEGSQVITLAPKKEQLTLHLWKEIGRLWPLFHRLRPEAELLSLMIRMRPGATGEIELDENGIPKVFSGWGAVGFVAGVSADEDVANRARGFHGEDMLFVIEETPGMHDAILSAIKFTCTAPHNLRLFLGNPDHQHDALARASREPGVVPIRASGYDHPNVVTRIPTLVTGAISHLKIDEWRAEYGEDDPLFQAKARGIPPAQGVDALIRAEWIDAAFARHAEWKEKHCTDLASVGADVAASENRDRASLAFGRGPVCLTLQSWTCPDPGAFARDRIYPLLDLRGEQVGGLRSSRIGIDSVGVGVGAISEMNRLQQPVIPLNGGSAFRDDLARDGDVFNNLRSQMHWQLRQDLFHGRIALPKDEELKQDLLAPKWWTRGGKKIVESKEDLKSRLSRSPDKGDAVVYWNWMRQGFEGRIASSHRLPIG